MLFQSKHNFCAPGALNFRRKTVMGPPTAGETERYLGECVCAGACAIVCRSGELKTTRLNHNFKFQMRA
jgi:hypothetical protein